MTEIRRQDYGPFSGYVSIYAKDLIPPDAAGPDSRDWRYNPTLGKWLERGGSAILGDTLPSPVGLTGAYQTPTAGRTRQIFEFPAILDQSANPLFTDGVPSYGALYDNPAGAEGWLYFRSSNSSGSNQFPGKSWSATTYPLTGAKSFIKAVPMWSGRPSRVGAGQALAQAHIHAGGRRVFISGKWMYTVGEYVDSRRWNMLFNDSSSSPTRKERHWPMGILPVLYPAWIKAADFPTPNQPGDTWQEGDKFFISACYVFEDGTWGPPFIPRALYGANVAGGYNDGYGFVKLFSGVPNTKWAYIPWTNIAQPPPGCTHTVLLRTPKVNGDALFPILHDPDDPPGAPNFGVVAIIPKGVTSFKDYSGDDSALLFDFERIRSDHISPPRARYIGGAEGRVFLGYTRWSPQIAYIAHTGTTNPNDNTADDDETLGATQYFIRVTAPPTSSLLQLRKATSAFPSAPTTNAIDYTGKTLQELADLVNATTVASTTGEWRMQLAPGVDGSLPCSVLLDQSFAYDYGDDGLVNDGTAKNMRAFAQGYPAVLQWLQSEVLARQPEPDREGIYFSRGAPESAAVGVTAAPNFWVAGNYRKPPEFSGAFMGFAAVEEGMVCFYADKVWIIRNKRDFRSGRDEDFYMSQISNDGCIAWNSIVEFNNAVGWLSPVGYKVWGPDLGEQLISGAIYDPTENTGDLAYEIGKCMASSAANTDDMRFHAHRFGHVLTIKYRSSASATVPDFEMEYDFSEGGESGGVRELFRGGNPATPFGWSTPFRRPGEAMGSYRGASGLVKLHAIETQGSAGSGRIDQIDTGYQDNGTAIDTVLHTKVDDLGELGRRIRDLEAAYEYTNPPSHTMTVTLYRDRNRLAATTYTLPNTGTMEVATVTKRTKLDGQTPARCHERKIAGTRVSAGPAEVWRIRRKVKILDTPQEVSVG